MYEVCMMHVLWPGFVHAAVYFSFVFLNFVPFQRGEKCCVFVMHDAENPPSVYLCRRPSEIKTSAKLCSRMIMLIVVFQSDANPAATPKPRAGVFLLVGGVCFRF